MIAAAREKVNSGLATASPPESASAKRPKKRVRNFTANDRAAHRVFEKGRREAFRERLLELSAQLPVLADTEPQRLSKHVVIDESIARHKLLRARCLDALYSIRTLIQERDELLAEVNTWRTSAGASLREPTALDVNVDGLVELELEPQQPPLANQSSSTTGMTSADDQTQTDHANQTDDTSHVSIARPTEPTNDAIPVSTTAMRTLVPEPSWPAVTQATPASFPNYPQANGNSLQNEDLDLRSGAPQGPLANPPGETNSYQLLGDISLDRNMPFLDPMALQNPLPGPHDPEIFEPSSMAIATEHSAATGLAQEPILEQNHSWAFWPT